MRGHDKNPDAKLKVLLVDDHEDNADALALLLELEGFEVAKVAARDVVQRFSEFRPHAALIDLKMPLFSGFDVLQALLGTYLDDSECRFIAMSGLGGKMVVDTCIDAGFNAYLLKPFSVEDFKCALSAPRDSFFAVSGLGQLR